MKIFFILSLGRSGSKFLANLLNKDTNALVFHEPSLLDKKILFYEYTNQFDLFVNNYYKSRFANLIPKDNHIKIYGEVNSYLRYSSKWLKNNLNAKVFFLVRDGRDFVRSAYPRNIYTEFEEQQSIVPNDKDDFASQWNTMNRFQKLCWYWNHTNEYLFESIGSPIHFEKIVQDYEYFEEKILIPTGIDLSFEIWKNEITRPINKSKSFFLKKKLTRYIFQRNQSKLTFTKLPHWSCWEAKRKTDFKNICGNTMAKIGYTLSDDF